MHPDVATKTAAYDDVVSLTSALEGQHAIVEAFNPAAATNQATIVRASLAAGVRHLITPDFSTDSFNEHANEIRIFEPKKRAQCELEAAVKSSGGAMSWTAIIVGGWFDWGIENGQFLVDTKNRSITRFGSGDQKFSISRVSLCADALVAVLRSPDEYRNRPAYFASHTVSINQIISIMRNLGIDNWRIVDKPLAGLMEHGRQLWDQDTVNGVTDRLHSEAYPLLGIAALFDETNRYDGDFSHKAEPGWDEGEKTLQTALKKLISPN